MDLPWGRLAPGTAVDERRVRTLGLGSAVRRFNELAVPGLGRASGSARNSCCRHSDLKVAKAVRDAGGHGRYIEVATAIEALGCWLGFNANGWSATSD